MRTDDFSSRRHLRGVKLDDSRRGQSPEVTDAEVTAL